MTPSKCKLLCILTLAALLFSATSCSLLPESIHAHTYQYEQNENAHWMVCISCGEKTAEEPHTLSLKDTVDPTCEHAGYTLYECATCRFATEEIKPIREHRFETVAGSTARVCATCYRQESDLHELPDAERYGYRYLASLDNSAVYLETYTKIAAGTGARKDSLPINEKITETELLMIFHCCSVDHPEFFWTSSALRYTSIGDTIKEVFPTYLMEASELENAKKTFQSSADKILSGISAEASEFEKELYLHDYIVTHAVYDETYNAPMTHSAYGNLVNGTSVCDGYAKLFQFLLCRSGVLATTLSGYAKENHSWNAVCLSGDWYMVDPTWDDPTGQEPDEVSHNYFNCSWTYFSQNHSFLLPSGSIFENYFKIPECNSEAYNYFTYFGYEGSLLAATVERIVRLQLKAGQKNGFQIRFSGHGSTAEERKNAIRYFIENDPLFYPALANALGRSMYSIKLNYSISDDGYILKLSVK